MSLFKVVPHDRSKRVLVKGSTVSEVTHSAKKKLDLPDGNYKITLEEDGTEIDDDEILLDLASMVKAPTNLMILLEDKSWKPPGAVEVRPSSSLESDQPIHPEVNTEPAPVEPRIKLGASICDKMPERLIDCCQKGLRAYPVDRRLMVAVIANYMVDELKDTTRRTAERIAQAITEKYPKSFADTIGGAVIGAGMESLRSQIYNAVNYRKNDKLIKRQRPQVDDPSDEEDMPSQPKSGTACIQDEYGCVAYQPLLPSTESKTSQEEKQILLKEQITQIERDEERVTQLIEDTYPSQRIAINAKKRDLTLLFTEWPHLAQSEYLKQHASLLLGKSVQDVWEKSLVDNSTSLRKYLSITQKSKALKSRQKNSSSDTSAEASANTDEILEILAKAKEAGTASTTETPLISSIFPLITVYMKEDQNLLYTVIDDDVESADVIRRSMVQTPVLIIRGKSYFDENARFDVVVEKEVRIQARGILDGILITFLSYYVFGYTYPQKLCKTLEFIQRVLLQINPKNGTKIGGKKRKLVSYDPTVLKLSDALAAFKEA